MISKSQEETEVSLHLEEKALEAGKILQKFKLAHKNSRLDGRLGNTPRNLWGNLIQRKKNNPFHQGLNPKNGVDYGSNRFDMFNLMWLSLPQSQPKAIRRVTVTNCVTDDKGARSAIPQ